MSETFGEVMTEKVSIMRLLLITIMTISMLISVPASAGKKFLVGTPLSKTPQDSEKEWYYPFEISNLQIKQTNDGTGIIKGISCGDCGYQIVKIMPDTKVIVNGIEVNLLRARERAGLEAYIEFDRETAEVKHIYWSE